MNNKNAQIFLAIVLPLAFVALMVLFFPFRYRFEFDPDEGINLIKAMMTLRGFELYSEVWSDQPPVFNIILTVWFRIFGMNVNAGRILILGFSTVLLSTAMYYLQRFWGVLHAIIGMIVIGTLPFYTTLSISIMIGLPSIAFALLSFVGLAIWHQDNRVFWLILSAVFLALSVMTKIWTVILVPIFLIGIFIKETALFSGEVNLRDSVRSLFIWSLGFMLIFGLITLVIIRPPHISQLIGVHLASGESDALQLIAAQNPINSYLDDSIPLFFLSFFGALIAFRSKVWHALYLVAWVLAAYLLLQWITPSWHHHQLLITIPAALLASIALGDAIVDIIGRIRGARLWTMNLIPTAAILLVSVFFAYQRIPPTLRGFKLDLPNFTGTYTALDQTDYEIVAIIRNYADKTNHLFTDRPIYAFRSGIPLHPYLAVMTRKRYETGQLSQEEIYSILIETKPEQVILGRFDIPAAQDYMEVRNFVRVDSSLRSRHYVKGDIYAEP